MESQWTLDPVSGGAANPLHASPWRAAWTAWRQAAQARRAGQRTATALHELDEHVLRDIGAPDWLLLETAVRRELELQRQSHWLRT
ncbi:hypothetical protein [Bordetella petrii]|uniref:hypothetical protein n=1 Tax=Bordetella petrii TaxID=94624 RepID=UPI00372E1EF9